MTDAKYNSRSMKGKVSDNVLSDLLAFSYSRIRGGPVVAYNNIDAGMQNVKCGTGMAAMAETPVALSHSHLPRH